jgi:hypothetical protein
MCSVPDKPIRSDVACDRAASAPLGPRHRRAPDRKEIGTPPRRPLRPSKWGGNPIRRDRRRRIAYTAAAVSQQSQAKKYIDATLAKRKRIDVIFSLPAIMASMGRSQTIPRTILTRFGARMSKARFLPRSTSCRTRSALPRGPRSIRSYR